MAYETKVFVVQKADAGGNLGSVIAVKLTHASAHAIAKRYAPALVHFVIADKSETLNMGQIPFQSSGN